MFPPPKTLVPLAWKSNTSFFAVPDLNGLCIVGVFWYNLASPTSTTRKPNVASKHAGCPAFLSGTTDTKSKCASFLFVAHHILFSRIGDLLNRNGDAGGW